MAKAKVAPVVEKTAVVRAKVSLPANATQMAMEEVEKLKMKLAAPAGKSILVSQSKEFKFPNPDIGTVKSFFGVIVGFTSLNTYYEGAFDRDNIVPPNCFAVGEVKNDDLVASKNSPDPQNTDGGGACSSCWANQWKSAAKGNGKACGNKIKLAILCSDGEVRPMTISSTALRPFGDYVRDVVQAHSLPPYGVMTEFTFADSDFSSVRCGNSTKLDNEQLALVLSLRDSAMQMIAVEPDVSEFEAKVVAAREQPRGKSAVKAKAK
jgi:hypothetical protein